MSQKAQWVVGAVVLLVLIAVAIYTAFERDTGVAVVVVAVVLLGAIALSIVVSRKQS